MTTEKCWCVLGEALFTLPGYVSRARYSLLRCLFGRFFFQMYVVRTEGRNQILQSQRDEVATVGYGQEAPEETYIFLLISQFVGCTEVQFLPKLPSLLPASCFSPRRPDVLGEQLSGRGCISWGDKLVGPLLNFSPGRSSRLTTASSVFIC